MAENRRGKENRYYFSRGQMILLGGFFVLASGVIFSLGMIIGKSIEERKIAKQEEPLVRIPVKPGNGAASQQPSEVTFNDAASKKPRTALVENTSQAKGSPQRVAKTQPRAPERASSLEKVATPATPKQSATAAKGRVTAPARVWRAQVNAFPDDRSARLLVDRLKNKGYNAYVSEVQNRGRTWYRVSVGLFDSRADAEKIVKTLKTKENYPGAFAASR